MEQPIKKSGDLHIVAAKSSSEKDFDFLIGKWKVHNRKLKSRLNGCSEWTEFEAQVACRKILNGCGNVDSFQTTIDHRPFEGMSLRLFNPRTKLWSIYWADSEKVELDIHKSVRLKTRSATSTRGTPSNKKRSSCSSAGMRVIQPLPFGLRRSLKTTGRRGNGTGI